MSNDQKFRDIVLLTECAKVMQALAETRHAETSSIRLGKELLDIAERMKAEIEEDIKRQKKQCKLFNCGWSEPKEFTREEYIDGAIHREAKEMMQPHEMYSEEYKHKLRDAAAKRWDEAK